MRATLLLVVLNNYTSGFMVSHHNFDDSVSNHHSYWCDGSHTTGVISFSLFSCMCPHKVWSQEFSFCSITVGLERRWSEHNFVECFYDEKYSIITIHLLISLSFWNIWVKGKRSDDKATVKWWGEDDHAPSDGPFYRSVRRRNGVMPYGEAEGGNGGQ
jgi:hypothetical protein